jgi:hypothetical protein
MEYLDAPREPRQVPPPTELALVIRQQNAAGAVDDHDPLGQVARIGLQTQRIEIVALLGRHGSSLTTHPGPSE